MLLLIFYSLITEWNPLPNVSGSGGSTHIEFDQTGGILTPGEQIVVGAKLVADGDGQHRSLVKLSGPVKTRSMPGLRGSVAVAGSSTKYIEAFAVVVTPLAVRCCWLFTPLTNCLVSLASPLAT